MSRADLMTILVEDEGWRELRPLTWLRPACGLFVGAFTIAERWARAGVAQPAILCRSEVAPLCDPPGLAAPPQGEGARLWARDRWIPERSWAAELLGGTEEAVWRCEGRIVAVRTARAAPSREPQAGEPFWEGLASGIVESRDARGRWLAGLPDLVREGSARIAADLEEELERLPPSDSFGGAAVLAPGMIRIGRGCQIDPGSVLDAREGPIVLGGGTRVFPHTWIRGPFGCRPDALLLGGRIGEGSYLGPGCRVRGEVEASTFHGFDNKAHDGFVGHSYVGEWVNLGALTTTSDLKNNYGPIRLAAYGRSFDSGERKLGSFIGDHAKTRIGALLNTGSVIGLGANLFDEGTLFPKWVPDFAWGGGPEGMVHDLDRCLRTIETVLGRRGKRCEEALRQAVRVAFEESRETAG